MGLAKTFRDLDVYQGSLELVVDLHAFCKTLPGEERFSLGDQMRRSSRSVCANVAEAWRKRRYPAAFAAKLSDAEAEAAESQCWLDVALKLDYMAPAAHAELDRRYAHVIAQLVTMIHDADRWCKL